jgi:hypothetical protein
VLNSSYLDCNVICLFGSSIFELVPNSSDCTHVSLTFIYILPPSINSVYIYLDLDKCKTSIYEQMEHFSVQAYIASTKSSQALLQRL